MEGMATAVCVVCIRRHTLLCFYIATGLEQIHANILREYSEKGMRWRFEFVFHW